MNNSKKDINLKEAVRRHEQKLPPMPADLNDRVMKSLPLTPSEGKSLTPRPLQGERELKRGMSPLSWRGIGGGLIAASIIIAFILWPDSPAVVEQQPVVAASEMPSQASDYSESSDYSDYSDESKPSESSDYSESPKPAEPVSPKLESVLAQAEQQPAETGAVKLSTTADSLAYYLTRLENQMGDCRDSICLAHLSELMRADERIKGLVNKIIHKQVETACQEEYLVDTTIHYIPL